MFLFILTTSATQATQTRPNAAQPHLSVIANKNASSGQQQDLVESDNCANTPQIHNSIPNSALVGQTRMRYLFWDIYDAQLFAPQGKYSANQPFALKLTYLRSIQGEDIAKKSVEEIQKQKTHSIEAVNNWSAQMAAIFPDVEADTCILGLVDTKHYTHFFFQGQPIGSVLDPDFTRAFFNIWLGEQTSEPKHRRQLLGLGRKTRPPL